MPSCLFLMAETGRAGGLRPTDVNSECKSIPQVKSSIICNIILESFNTCSIFFFTKKGRIILVSEHGD